MERCWISDERMNEYSAPCFAFLYRECVLLSSSHLAIVSTILKTSNPLSVQNSAHTPPLPTLPNTPQHVQRHHHPLASLPPPRPHPRPLLPRRLHGPAPDQRPAQPAATRHPYEEAGVEFPGLCVGVGGVA
ncbi:hypothetical protein P153DRAFT_401027 [Dothidotthia symphoricarpi CBS 119687]|uniref:Uncharacterized protein n=1 Tax=Dothidotthia symphoricarpi CBS 119687 TaxID=1392245 RepID=A0A6A6A1G5_9PLEO|nr:uncharacterized protein P153DRAFT_401027 [Dothidotthia symphoricarpi CBS 119687]KAF2124401.1 hypothetical protein P153DRAFT_401027 [Dothidotthia symphoricarpi CBS 119687]